MSLQWNKMSEAIYAVVQSANSMLDKVISARSSMRIKKTTELQWKMAVMQQVLTASSNVIEGSLSVVKGALGNINR